MPSSRSAAPAAASASAPAPVAAPAFADIYWQEFDRAWPALLGPWVLAAAVLGALLSLGTAAARSSPSCQACVSFSAATPR